MPTVRTVREREMPGVQATTDLNAIGSIRRDHWTRSPKFPSERVTLRHLPLSYRHPQRAADCACPAKKPLTVAAPLVRSSELPMFDGHALALTGWLEADQAKLTLLHCPEAEGALKATAYRFCASRQSLEPTGAFAFVPV